MDELAMAAILPCTMMAEAQEPHLLLALERG